MTERAGQLAEIEAILRDRDLGFAEILDVLGDAVTIRARDDTIIYANRAALTHMGFGSLAEMQARPPGSIMSAYLVRGEDGEALSMDDIPSVRLLRGENAEPRLIRTVHRASGALRALAMRSVLIVPIRSATRVLGAMTLVASESGRRFSDDDVSFAEQLADRAAGAIENARLYRAQTQVAQTLQRSLLPESIPHMPGWQVAALYRPAGDEDQREVGGDFYDFVQTDDGWIVVIGDVTGKGVEAAALTSLVRHGARFVARMDPRPATIVRHLDDALKQRPTLSLCTVLCARLAPDHLVMCSAGHPLPLIVDADGDVRESGTSHPVLGMRNPLAWRDERIAIEPGATVVLYTDGVTDTRGAQERYGEDRLRSLLSQHGSSSPGELLAALDGELRAFQVGRQADDTAIIVLHAQRAGAMHRTTVAGAARLGG